MMYSVIDFKTTLLVDRIEDSFEIANLSTGKKILIEASKLHSSCFKYENEFISKFISAFGDKNITNVIMSTAAAHLMLVTLSFNRLDS